MKLSSLDIRKQEFARKLRGYDPDEVQAFLQLVAGQWEEMLAEQRRYEQKLNEADTKLKHYERVEEALQETVRMARESAHQQEARARQKAEGIIREAELRAEEIRRDAERQRTDLRQETVSLRARRGEVLSRLRGFLRTELDLLERYEEEPAGMAAEARYTGVEQSGRTGGAPAASGTMASDESGALGSSSSGIRASAAPPIGSLLDNDLSIPEAEPAPKPGEGEGSAAIQRTASRWVNHPILSSSGASVSGEGPGHSTEGKPDPDATPEDLERIRRIVDDLE